MNGPGGVLDAEPRSRAQGIFLRRNVGVERADVAPVARFLAIQQARHAIPGEVIREYAVGSRDPRQEMPAEVALATLVRLFEQSDQRTRRNGTGSAATVTAAPDRAWNAAICPTSMR